MSVKLENEKLLVEIAELGAEVTRLYDKEKNTVIICKTMRKLLLINYQEHFVVTHPTAQSQQPFSHILL